MSSTYVSQQSQSSNACRWNPSAVSETNSTFVRIQNPIVRFKTSHLTREESVLFQSNSTVWGQESPSLSISIPVTLTFVWGCDSSYRVTRSTRVISSFLFYIRLGSFKITFLQNKFTCHVSCHICFDNLYNSSLYLSLSQV